MRKHLSKWHRRAGIFAALIAIYLSITGLMLNHSHDLGLDTARLQSGLLLKWYGVKLPDGLHVQTEKDKVYMLGTSLFLNNRNLGQYDSALSGAAEHGQLLVIALKDSLLILSQQGDLIETLTLSSGLPGKVDHLASIDGQLIIQSGAEIYRSDNELLSWRREVQLPAPPNWSKTEPLTAETVERLMPLLPAYGPSWERVLQDLHSGRFFGLPGTLLIDLTGIILLLLSISGIVSFTLRKKAIRRRSFQG